MYKARISEHQAVLTVIPANERSAYDLAHAPQPPVLPPNSKFHPKPQLRIKLTDYWWCEQGGYEEDDISQFFAFEDLAFEEEGVDVRYKITEGVEMITCWPEDRGISSRNTDSFKIEARIDSVRNNETNEYIYGLQFNRAISHPKLSSSYELKIEIKP